MLGIYLFTSSAIYAGCSSPNISVPITNSEDCYVLGVATDVKAYNINPGDTVSVCTTQAGLSSIMFNNCPDITGPVQGIAGFKIGAQEAGWTCSVANENNENKTVCK